MSLKSRFLASCVAALAIMASAQAIAADYDPPIFVEEAPEWVPVEIGSGWYLRGDVTYTVDTEPRELFGYRTFDIGSGTYGSDSFDTTSLGENFSFGGGVGYHFNDWLRFDATLDAGKLGCDGSTSSIDACPGGPAGTTCRSEDSAKAFAWSGLLNGYVDIATIAGFTPYVGAGAGYTYLRWDGLDSNYFC